MGNPYDKLRKTFDIPNQTSDISKDDSGDENKAEVVSDKNVEIKNIGQSDSSEDYQYVREHLKTLMIKSNEVLEDIIDLARDNGSSRAYEVVGQILKGSSEISEKLLQLHKNNKELNEVNNNVNVTNNNAMFFGSTNELLKALKSQNIIEDNK